MKICFKILVVFIFFGSISYIYAAPEYGQVTKFKNAYNDIYSVLLYNKAFAQRFGLDVAKAVKMAPGLYAVRYRLYKTPHKEIPYQCGIDLYVSSKLKINYPEGPNSQAGDYDALMRQWALVDMGLKRTISPRDGAVMSHLDDQYNESRFFINFKKLTYQQALYMGNDPAPISNYRVNVFPGISFLSFGAGCTYLTDLQDGATIWLSKVGQPYTKRVKGDLVNNLAGYYRLALPVSKLFQRHVKYAACIINNETADAMRKWSPYYKKVAGPDKNCNKYLMGARDWS